MTLETNAFTSYLSIGNREDLSDIIYNVDPHETPLLTMMSRTKATNITHEWQTDELATPSATNAHLEGDAFSPAVTTPTVRLSNYCQISKKTVRVTNTQEAIKHAGRASEVDYQKMKRGLELKNDMESSIVSNNAKVAGNGTTTRYLGGIESWYEDNVSRGPGGANGGNGVAATDGTLRPFTELLLKDMCQSAWNNGGKPDILALNGVLKQRLSTFTGNATPFSRAEDKKIIAAVDVYVSDFGELKAVPDRHVRSRTVHGLQKDMWAVSYLRPIHTEPMAPTGDSKSWEMRVEYTLEARNQKSSFVIADVN